MPILGRLISIPGPLLSRQLRPIAISGIIAAVSRRVLTVIGSVTPIGGSAVIDARPATVRCRPHKIVGGRAPRKRLLFGRRLVHVAYARLRVAARRGMFPIISSSTTPARLLIGDRLGPVAFRRVLVAIRGCVLAITGGSAAQPRTLVGRRLRPIALGRGRLPPPGRPIPIDRGMTTIPPTLIELRRLRIRINAHLAIGVNLPNKAPVVRRGVRSIARVFFSLGQSAPAEQVCPGSLLLC